MKKLLSIKYTAWSFNLAILLLRSGLGLLMMNYGYDKLVHFGTKHNNFMNFMGIGSSLSLALVIFAEFFCSLFLILGLFTRFATIPLIFSLSVALFKVHDGDIFGKGEIAALYLISCFVLLLVGPGKVSVDNMIGK